MLLSVCPVVRGNHHATFLGRFGWVSSLCARWLACVLACLRVLSAFLGLSALGTLCPFFERPHDPGALHCAVVGRSGALYTFGWGMYGQLGHGDVGTRFVPTVRPQSVCRQSCWQDLVGERGVESCCFATRL